MALNFRQRNTERIRKLNNSGVWVKGDDGNQNENVDYFGVL